MQIRDLLSIDPNDIGSNVEVSAWVKTKRDAKGFSFLELNDGSCLANLQAILNQEITGYQEFNDRISTGAAVKVCGKLVASPGKGQSVELQADSISLYGESDVETYPLQKKRHSNEFLRTIAHLRARTNTFGAVFRLRSALSFAIHKYFCERGFVNLHTPIITTSDCEGAGEMFTVTAFDLEKLPKNDKSEVDFSKDFFSSHAKLTVSGQLEAEAVALAMSKVYTFGPTFRAENSNTARHLAEFWMVEPEVAFVDLHTNMDLAQDFLKNIISYALDHCAADMEFFDRWIEKGIIKSLEALVSADFERITYTEAIKALADSGKSFEFPCEWGSDLQTEHERYLTEEFVGRPVFVTDYPREIKAFYMRLNDDQKTVAAMDLLVPRLGEIIGGAQREEREAIVTQRLADAGLDPDTYSWYLDLRRFGSAPHAGFGLGFERLLMYISGISNIRDAIPFPRTPGNAEF